MKCPICKCKVDESRRDERGSPYPFCSERCKLIDLGRWLGGKYQLPAVEEDDVPTALPPYGDASDEREH